MLKALLLRLFRLPGWYRTEEGTLFWTGDRWESRLGPVEVQPKLWRKI